MNESAEVQSELAKRWMRKFIPEGSKVDVLPLNHPLRTLLADRLFELASELERDPDAPADAAASAREKAERVLDGRSPVFSESHS